MRKGNMKIGIDKANGKDISVSVTFTVITCPECNRMYFKVRRNNRAFSFDCKCGYCVAVEAREDTNNED